MSGGTTPIILGQSIGTLALSGQTGTVVNWRERLGAGAWINEINNTNSYSDIPNATGIWEYQVLVQSGSCPAVSSTSMFITVNPSSEGTVTGGTSPVCLGSSTGTMTLSGYTGTIVKWQSSVSPFTTWTDIANTTDTYSEIPATAGNWEYRAIVHNVSDLPSAPTMIVVNPATVGGTVSGGSTICAGSPSGQLTLSGQTGTVVKWQSSVSPFTTWTDIVNTATTYTTGVLAQTTQFRAVVSKWSLFCGCFISYHRLGRSCFGWRSYFRSYITDLSWSIYR